MITDRSIHVDFESLNARKTYTPIPIANTIFIRHTIPKISVHNKIKENNL